MVTAARGQACPETLVRRPRRPRSDAPTPPSARLSPREPQKPSPLSTPTRPTRPTHIPPPQPPAKPMPTKQLHGLPGAPNTAWCSATGTCPAPLHHGSARGGNGPSQPLAGPPAGWGAVWHGRIPSGRRAEDWPLKQGGAEPARRPVCDARGKGDRMSSSSRGKERARKRRVPEDFPGLVRSTRPEPSDPNSGTPEKCPLDTRVTAEPPGRKDRPPSQSRPTDADLTEPS